MHAASTEYRSAPRSPRRRATPWGVRLLLGVSILFGIWVDISSIGATKPDATPNGADRHQVQLLGLSNDDSTVGAFVKTLASRRS